jgi:hypothetical protein
MFLIVFELFAFLSMQGLSEYFAGAIALPHLAPHLEYFSLFRLLLEYLLSLLLEVGGELIKHSLQKLAT